MHNISAIGYHRSPIWRPFDLSLNLTVYCGRRKARCIPELTVVMFTRVANCNDLGLELDLG